MGLDSATKKAGETGGMRPVRLRHYEQTRGFLVQPMHQTRPFRTAALGEPLRQIHAGRLRPAKIDVRVLLPSRDIDLAFPTPVDASDAGQLQRTWLAHRNAQGQVLRHNLRMLRSTHGIDTTRVGVPSASSTSRAATASCTSDPVPIRITCGWPSEASAST